MKWLLSFMLVAGFNSALFGQVALGVQPIVGYSLSGTKNLLPFTSAYGFMPSLSLLTKNENGLVIGGGFIFMETENPLLKKQFARFFSVGMTATPAKSIPKFSIGAHGLRTRLYLRQDQEAFPVNMATTEKIDWDQWGYQVNVCYNFKKWLAGSICYMRFCEREFDSENYQSILNLGILFRWVLEENVPVD